jgi:hypothetical protein
LVIFSLVATQSNVGGPHERKIPRIDARRPFRPIRIGDFYPVFRIR